MHLAALARALCDTLLHLIEGYGANKPAGLKSTPTQHWTQQFTLVIQSMWVRKGTRIHYVYIEIDS